MPALVAARPTIAVSGQDRPLLAEGLLGLVVHETVAGLFRCEAVFGNWGQKDGAVGFLYFDRALLDFGKPFVVKVGGDALFDGRITALEARFPEGRPPELAVLAEDRFQDLRMTRRTRTFADVTDSAVFQQIASDHGVSAQVNVSGPTHKVLAQVNQSDLAFVRDRARSIDAELWMAGSTLNVAGRTARAGRELELAFGAGLREFSALSDLAGQRTSVSVNGWDVSSKSALAHEADTAAINGEVGNDESGASLLGSALGTRKEAVAHAVPMNADEARSRAEAYFKTIARRFVTGRGVAETTARLRVGASTRLSGLGPLFSGTYYVSEVRHVFDGARGIRTEFTAERPGIGRA